MRKWLGAVAVACLLFGGGWTAAQQSQFRNPQTPVPQDIRSGADIGFRVRGMKDGRALGTLVVRTADGAWVEAHPEPSRGFVVPLDTK